MASRDRAPVTGTHAEAIEDVAAGAPSAPATDTGVVLLQMGAWPATVGIARAIEAIAVELHKRGLTMVTHHHVPGVSLADTVARVRPSVVLTDSPLGPSDVQMLQAARIAHVSLGIVDAEAPEVTLALWQLGHAQASELAKLGHRHLVYVDHPDPTRTAFANRRFGGVRAAAQEYALPPVGRVPSSASTVDMASMVEQWDNRVTAAVCYNDEVAYQVIEALRQMGRSVPRHLSVIGADDLIVSELATPGITSAFTDPAAAAVSYANTVCQRLGMPVAAPDGRPLTVVRRRASVAGPRAE